jgi:hypothetical protein
MPDMKSYLVVIGTQGKQGAEWRMICIIGKNRDIAFITCLNNYIGGYLNRVVATYQIASTPFDTRDLAAS